MAYSPLHSFRSPVMPSFSLRYPDKETKPPMSAARRRKLIFSYIPDWTLTIALAALFFSLDPLQGFRREFSLQDISIRHPYAVHERVPNVALYFICIVAPLVLQPIISFVTVRSWWDIHNATLGLILSLATTGAITQFVKLTVGRPRPDFIDRCQPPANATDPPFGLSVWTICTQTDSYIMKDGFRSFFSGHSSLSFAGLGFFSFYLAGKMHLFDKRGHTGKTWLALSPLSAAALVAISRTMDSRHHWHDVLVGAIVGTVLAYFCYRQYFPSLASELAHHPHGPRIKEEDVGLPTHIESSGAGYDNIGHNYELSGTIPRPEIGPLEEIWKSDGTAEPSMPAKRSNNSSGHLPQDGRVSPRS
ncbi:hypothetical protein M378DRAFT_158421 [Amanita muscaria Koide BX008]|uniref:Phosphatidic acid phosphatase type 2/haloperoxidase domain-containing protein n=1 Tax=Amanita muscaria (strain Koide BX008) TaxID=946122 RepID=A0A0C2XI12_AMAMK|nr:hypothetical protein M378DRAFT_158421 [Amanita muscaria Koide BX008]